MFKNILLTIGFCMAFTWSIKAQRAVNTHRDSLESVTVTSAQPASSVEEVFIRPKKISKDSFPYSWLGVWVGNLEIYNAKGLRQTVPMELTMLTTDTVGVFQWNIIYGNDREKGLRPYLLRTINAAEGRYLCDEVNSIKMESYLFGSRLYCTYSVEGNAMTTLYEKIKDAQGEAMIFDIAAWKEQPVSVTGNETVKGEVIPVVKSFPMSVNQRAVLRRKK
jgi:hypothetical protein